MERTPTVSGIHMFDAMMVMDPKDCVVSSFMQAFYEKAGDVKMYEALSSFDPRIIDMLKSRNKVEKNTLLGHIYQDIEFRGETDHMVVFKALIKRIKLEHKLNIPDLESCRDYLEKIKRLINKRDHGSIDYLLSILNAKDDHEINFRMDRIMALLTLTSDKHIDLYNCASACIDFVMRQIGFEDSEDSKRRLNSDQSSFASLFDSINILEGLVGSLGNSSSDDEDIDNDEAIEVEESIPESIIKILDDGNKPVTNGKSKKSKKRRNKNKVAKDLVIQSNQEIVSKSDSVANVDSVKSDNVDASN